MGFLCSGSQLESESDETSNSSKTGFLARTGCFYGTRVFIIFVPVDFLLRRFSTYSRWHVFMFKVKVNASDWHLARVSENVCEEFNIVNR